MKAPVIGRSLLRVTAMALAVCAAVCLTDPVYGERLRAHVKELFGENL